MASLKTSLTGGIAALAVTATLFAGTAPAQAHDGRNAALIGGLVVGALIGGALASETQAYERAPAYRSHYRYPAYDGYGYAPAYRYRNCDHDYGSASDWDDDD
ncbi:conserved exported hypothetical protein [Bradyrhizobium sp. STM 3843]|uniref:hypothetical protein n=1 Tax=Bradyrhizobium sp. STM 3843 TaxID=551947 RepID=UPI0002403898|nr:hypothetical protein [Bradyrhizobium sp. STM 3843]CCE11489.1 conserved exported hypothetical protein [Bradyrhizobium sp. STM 3843]